MHKAALPLTQYGRQTAMTGVFLLTCLVYLRVLGHEFVRWDDGMLIYENPAIRGITPWTLTWVFTHFDPELYIPVTFISYQINYLLGGIQPFVYHLTNLLLHAGNAALIVWLVHLLTGKMRVAVLCGLLFAIHPLHTEAVAWASGRKDVLSGIFFLGSWIAWQQWWSGDGTRRSYAASIAFHLLALLSKVMAATLPAVLLLHVILFEPRRTREAVRALLPHITLSSILVVVGFLGKERLVAATSLLQKALMACVSTVFYIKQILIPRAFSLLYPFPGEVTFFRLDVMIAVAVMTLLLLAALIFWKKRPAITFCILGYIGTLAPTFLNFSKGTDFDVYFASDRYAYIPSIFVFLLAAVFVDRFSDMLEKGGPAKLPRSPFFILTLCMTVILSLLAIRQSDVWQNTRTLFAHVISVYPEMSHVAHNNLANMERLEGNLEAAIIEAQKALAIRPHAKTWTNLGAVYRKQGNFPEAHRAYDEALKLDPKSAYAHFGLGIVLLQEGKEESAKAEYLRALELDATVEEIHVNLGALEAKNGNYEAAAAEYRKAIAVNPFQVQALFNLGVALTQLKRTDEAVHAYREAIRFQPSLIPARINLGLLLANAGDIDGAKAQFQAILAIDPQNRAAKSALQQLQ